MKIITWNCNGAFRKKFEYISVFEADVYIIQECENPAETNDIKYKNWTKNYLWIGDNKNKGLGIFAKEEFKLEKLDWSNQFKDHQVKYFLPCKISEKYTLLAVWTHKNNSPNFGYIGQFWKYLQVNKIYIKNSIIAGDFNSNSIWDVWDRWWNHSDIVKELYELDIHSIYHSFYNEVQGKETKPTLYFQRKKSLPYHIDYIFLPKKLIEKIKNIEIGYFDKWISQSDHMPIICELEIEINDKFYNE